MLLTYCYNVNHKQKQILDVEIRFLINGLIGFDIFLISEYYVELFNYLFGHKVSNSPLT